jgi:hypothetical protein
MWYSNDMTKTKGVRIRLTDEQYAKVQHHSKSRKVTFTQVLTELIEALPDEPTAVAIAKIIYQIKD